MGKGTLHKIYLDETNYEVLKEFKRICGPEISEDDIINTAFSLLVKKLREDIKKGKKEE